MNPQVVTEALSLLTELVFLAASVLMWYGIRFLKRRLTREQQQLLSDLVRATVLYVQQIMPAADPQEKLNAALIAASHLAKKKGIPVKEDVLLVLIESHLKTLKHEFGEAWGQQE
ncbi:MAG: phage holin, LLH family [Bacillota bacterium]|nr:phage holin, LLH family [Bacillota bacterium]